MKYLITLLFSAVCFTTLAQAQPKEDQRILVGEHRGHPIYIEFTDHGRMEITFAKDTSCAPSPYENITSCKRVDITINLDSFEPFKAKPIAITKGKK